MLIFKVALSALLILVLMGLEKRASFWDHVGASESKKNLKINLGAGFINFIVIRFLFILILSSWLKEWVPSTWNYIDLLWIVALDLGIYIQHRLFHKLSFLWRFHWAHHTDQALHWASGVRFHLGEVLMSLGFKLFIVVIFQIPLPIYLLYETLLAGFSLFNHSAIQLPDSFERLIRWIFVTPQMHWIHHSIIPQEMHSNFGNILSLWDRIFRTYLNNGQKSYPKIDLGILGLTGSLSWKQFWWGPFENRNFNSLNGDVLSEFEKPAHKRSEGESQKSP